jgi:hypothetical protein
MLKIQKTVRKRKHQGNGHQSFWDVNERPVTTHVVLDSRQPHFVPGLDNRQKRWLIVNIVYWYRGIRERLSDRRGRKDKQPQPC